MRPIREFLSPECAAVQPGATDKDDLLRRVSEVVAGGSGLEADEVLGGLRTREDLGSTGIGRGVAIPHCRLAGCAQTYGVLLRLESPVDFDSIDSEPVDLVFALVGPEDDRAGHLDALATVARRFNLAAFSQALREAPDGTALYEVATGFDSA